SGTVLASRLLSILSLETSQVMAGKCDTIYKGFAGCLISLGDSMAQSVRQQQEEGGEEAQELDTICKSWDDFHTCASEVLSSCPEEAAAIWESLRQESRKIQFQGNLQELPQGGHHGSLWLCHPGTLPVAVMGPRESCTGDSHGSAAP
uniref:Neuritin 1 like n=1 Tax=Falco tinnunculus TaxID=100819 RepID=A0A8C4XJW1_FALTI